MFETDAGEVREMMAWRVLSTSRGKTWQFESETSAA